MLVLQTKLYLLTFNSEFYKLTSPCFWVYREADESRLREVCESFLGPPTGMGGAASSDANSVWDPCVLVRIFF